MTVFERIVSLPFAKDHGKIDMPPSFLLYWKAIVMLWWSHGFHKQLYVAVLNTFILVSSFKTVYNDIC